ncbi:hypothetical protein T09_11802 [Trichinella sp. T9]|nr:hypothetical protein T09_11802 [Trichinella sp. T9]
MDNSLLDPGNPANPLILPRYPNNGNEILFVQSFGSSFSLFGSVWKIISKSNRSFLIWNVQHLVIIVIQQLQLECLNSPVVDKKKNNNSCEQERNKDWKD